MPSSLFINEAFQGTPPESDTALHMGLGLDNLSILGLGCDNEVESQMKNKSQNMTQCVPVPSSEHVAEIVGRQGCKIKALRAKTNTYIKTPVRGEEPVFVVTGRKEDVDLAELEILSAANHFSQIRAQRKNNLGLTTPNQPGQVTIQVRVPLRVVGLVVGPKGATVKRIQQQTNTYIVTPSRDREPVFEITGQPSNVNRAKEEIESYIAMRTGTSNGEVENNDFQNNGITKDLGLGVINPDLMNFYKSIAAMNSTGDLLPYTVSNAAPESTPDNNQFNEFLSTQMPDMFNQYDSETIQRNGSNFPVYETTYNNNGWVRRATSLGSATSMSPTGDVDHSSLRRILSDPLDMSSTQTFTPLPNMVFSTCSATNGSMTSPVDSALGSANNSVMAFSACTPPSSPGRKPCLVCSSNDITAALVPCGHNMFCMECAEQLVRSGAVCPLCSTIASQAIRIFS